MKIVALIRKAKNLPQDVPAQLRVGFPTVAGGPTVDKILYCRDGYSNGAKGKFPSYVVKYSEIPEVTQIPEAEVVDLSIDPEDKPNDEATVALPD